MPYITREDGERFIIPSYRDILSAKKNALLKREIMMLSLNYGEYITFQKKNADQFEVAFSPEPGYLLGECVWHYFKRPFDMIYCEAIPNTTDAVLVIVKSGSVYLDGSFPIDSIPEELVIFKSQQNNFAIFIHGDVPISEHPEEGKISFDAQQMRSFQVLEEPVFPTLPGVKAFQLQLVDTVLKANNIGTLPTKPIAIVIVVIVLLWLAMSFLTTNKESLPTTFLAPSNPYEEYITLMAVPDAGDELHEIVNKIYTSYNIPGWKPVAFKYVPGTLKTSVTSGGTRMSVLNAWANDNFYQVSITADGVFITTLLNLPPRKNNNTISRYQEVMAHLVDRLSFIIPGNVVTVTAIEDKKVYKDADMIVTINSISPNTLDMIAGVLKQLPLILTKLDLDSINGNLSGTINLKAVGN